MTTALTPVTATIVAQLPRIDHVPLHDGYYWYYKRGAPLPSLVMVGIYSGDRVIMEGGKYQKYWLPGEFFVGPIAPPASTPTDIAQSDDGHGKEIWIRSVGSNGMGAETTSDTHWEGAAELDAQDPALCLTERTSQRVVVKSERFTLEDVVVEGLRVKARSLFGEKEGAFSECAADLTTELRLWRERLGRGSI